MPEIFGDILASLVMLAFVSLGGALWVWMMMALCRNIRDEWRNR